MGQTPVYHKLCRIRDLRPVRLLKIHHAAALVLVKTACGELGGHIVPCRGNRAKAYAFRLCLASLTPPWPNVFLFSRMDESCVPAQLAIQLAAQLSAQLAAQPLVLHAQPRVPRTAPVSHAQPAFILFHFPADGRFLHAVCGQPRLPQIFPPDR